MRRGTYHQDAWVLQLVEQVAHFFIQQQIPAYLVGGAVRNLLLEQPCLDWDIVIDADHSRTGRQLAHALGASYAHLNTKASRITIRQDQSEIVFDLSSLHGGSLMDDLHLRDFTINAIAVPLTEATRHLAAQIPLPLIDPQHGAADIAARVLRAVNAQIFQQDPLRSLRAIRFIQHYQLALDPTTRLLLMQSAPRLLEVAPERIHDEIYTILQQPNAIQQLRLLDELGLLNVLIPELAAARGMQQPGLHYWDVFDHSLEAVAALERLAVALQQSPEVLKNSPLDPRGQDDLLMIQTLLTEAEQQGIFNFAILNTPALKLAALLHDIGKPITRAIDETGMITFYHHPQAGVPLAQHITRRIHTSTHDSRLIQQIVAHHMRPGQLSHDNVTVRAIRRYFVDLGPNGILVALVSLADHLAMRGPAPLTAAWERHLATVRLLLTSYIRERERILPPRLLQADELMHRLNLTPGPLVGQLLEALAEAQAEGHIRSKEEALWFAEEFLQPKTAPDTAS